MPRTWPVAELGVYQRCPRKYAYRFVEHVLPHFTLWHVLQDGVVAGVTAFAGGSDLRHSLETAEKAIAANQHLVEFEAGRSVIWAENVCKDVVTKFIRGEFYGARPSAASPSTEITARGHDLLAQADWLSEDGVHLIGVTGGLNRDGPWFELAWAILAFDCPGTWYDFRMCDKRTVKRMEFRPPRGSEGYAKILMEESIQGIEAEHYSRCHPSSPQCSSLYCEYWPVCTGLKREARLARRYGICRTAWR